MTALRSAAALLRWTLRFAVTLIVILLLLRAVVEYLPAIALFPPVGALVRWWDPVLIELVHGVGLSWSSDVRGLLLPGLAVGLIVLRTLVEDGVDRLLRRARRGAPARAEAEDAGARPPAAPSPADDAVTRTTAPPPLVTSVTGTSFRPATPPAAPQRPAHVGRYEILGELGQGSMGVVYKALDPMIGRTVAIKTVFASGAGPEFEQYKARALVEAKSAGRLNHPGIVSVHDVTEDASGRPCLVLEYVEGTALDKLAADAPVPLPRALDLVGQVARALAYAHAHGVIHRDIKLANILVTADGQAKLSDFGIAKMDGTGMTMAGQIMGTPAFMSPEQFTGGAVDHRSDIFSLGTVLYTLCTGSKPFPGTTFTAVAFKVAHLRQPPVYELKPDLPPELDRILCRCLAKDPAERYASAGDLAAELAALRSALPQVTERSAAAAGAGS